jgi:hypothetical protein
LKFCSRRGSCRKRGNNRRGFPSEVLAMKQQEWRNTILFYSSFFTFWFWEKEGSQRLNRNSSYVCHALLFHFPSLRNMIKFISYKEGSLFWSNF